jgi:Cys-tRNA synthase (O-phospho-L-seryl-tRNA:Cys-tRNA synthase)
MKLVLWCVLICLVILALRKKMQPLQRNRHADDIVADNNVELIVSCAYCGVHVPVSEAVKHADVVFCSALHRHQYLSS